MVLWKHLYEPLEVEAIEKCLCPTPSDRVTVSQLAKLLDVNLPEVLLPTQRTKYSFQHIFSPEAPKGVTDSVLEFCTFLRPKRNSIYVSVFMCTNMLPQEIGLTYNLSTRNIRHCVEEKKKKRKFTE